MVSSAMGQLSWMMGYVMAMAEVVAKLGNVTAKLEVRWWLYLGMSVLISNSRGTRYSKS